VQTTGISLTFTLVQSGAVLRYNHGKLAVGLDWEAIYGLGSKRRNKAALNPVIFVRAKRVRCVHAGSKRSQLMEGRAARWAPPLGDAIIAL
jgi:hypothetical protein